MTRGEDEGLDEERHRGERRGHGVYALAAVGEGVGEGEMGEKILPQGGAPRGGTVKDGAHRRDAHRQAAREIVNELKKLLKLE